MTQDTPTLNLLEVIALEMEQKGLKPGEIRARICQALHCSRSTYYNLLAARTLPRARLEQLQLLLATGQL